MSTEEKIHNYVTKQKRLLELELRSEEDESADQDDEERAGHILRNLRMDHISVGLVGKTVVHFVNGDPNSTILPAHRLSVGDEVEIVQKYKESEDKKGKSQSGAVICQVTDTTIALTMFDDSNSDDTTFDGLVCLIPRSSVEVHKKLVKGLHELQNSGIDHEYCGKVIETIFEPPQECYTPDISVQFEPFNKHLDTSQIEAIRFSLFGAQPIHIIHGPPGTGKTTTVVELIQQAVEKQKLRVLVTAPSNQAVDNILEKLVMNCDQNWKKKLRAVRLGHPARINPSILNYSLEYLVRNSDGTEIVNDIRKELKSFLDKTSSSKTRGMERRAAYREIKSLRKEIREREEKVISSILGNAQIVLATNVGAASSMLDRYGKLPFDIVIIDEAAQALEASCWIPTMRGKRLILAGDHCQLPPTIKCKRQDVIKELSRTMFERVMEENKFASRMLQIQYRMHQDISNWSSMAMYSGRLESHHSVKARKLSHLPSINNNYIEPDSVLSITRDATLLLVDTAGSDLFESVNAASSRYNEGEASIVVKHVENLITLGVKVEDIAVISPYNGQIEILKSLLLKNHPKLEIRSVDGFQGGEREAVVLSLVRSSERSGKDGVGFLRDNRRLNVAVTRAKRQCAVICDSDTVSQDKFLKDFVNWIEDHGEYLSAIDYSDHQEEKVLTAADLQMEHLHEREECKTDKVCSGRQAETMCSDLSTDEVLTKATHDVITEVKELEDQLSFFAEVTDDENEILQLHLSRSEMLLRYMDSLCRNLSLKSNMVSGNTETGLFSFSKCPVLSRNIESSPNFDKIKTDLNVFARSAEVDEYYDFTMTSDINIFELKALCKQLKLKYESIPGKFIVQIDKEANASPSILEDTFTPEHNMSDDQELYSGSDINSEELQMMKSETLEKSACPIAEKGTTVKQVETNPIDDKKKLDITSGEPNFRMNDLLGSLARERNSRINATQQQPLSSKTKSKSKGKNKGKRPTTKAAKNEEPDDCDDMAFLDSQIDKVMNSHGRTIEGKGKNFRTIINGNLLPKSKTKETKTRDPRQADALARKLKEAKIARSAKQKK